MNDTNVTEEAQAAVEPQLVEIEARVLGALMEKQLATPDAYPLTLNSLVAACNQKTSREPVSNYSSGEVERCLNELRDRKLVEVEYGSRANRFAQCLSRKLFLEKPAQAMLAIMLLRGPQTVNELYSRTERMSRFENATNVQELIDVLCQKTSPIIVKIPRQSGQREDRYTHLLCGQPDIHHPVPVDRLSTRSGAESKDDLVARIEELEQQLAKVLNHLDLDK